MESIRSVLLAMSLGTFSLLGSGEIDEHRVHGRGRWLLPVYLVFIPVDEMCSLCRDTRLL